MGRSRKNRNAVDFIDIQCYEAGYENLKSWAQAIDVPPSTLYNLSNRASNVIALELHLKLATSRGMTLDSWAKNYIASIRSEDAA